MIFKKLFGFFSKDILLTNLFGIPLFLKPIVILWMIFLTISNPDFALLCFFCYLITIFHEYGHALAARYYNYKTLKIELNLIGGAAFVEEIRDYKHQLNVAIAGPYVNLIMCPILFLFLNLNIFFEKIFVFNFIIMLSNSIPALPLDGGRVFRAVLSMITADYLYATKISVILSQIIFSFFVILGFYYQSFTIIITGVFLIFLAELELTAVKKQSLE
jgi:Zn-dependent protease